MSAGACRFSSPPDVVPTGDNSHGRYFRVGGGTVLLHRSGHALCLTCHAHTAHGQTGCAATRAAEAFDRGQVGAGSAAA